jgi:hypothetical protein
MSAKGNKAKASKSAPKDPIPKSAPSTGRLPVRSPIDDGMRSQMFNLSPALQYRRRDSSPLVPGLQNPPRKKRKSKVSSSDNTSASAADKSSSAEGTTISTSAVVKSSSAEDTASPASAADKSSSAEDTPSLPLGIRLSDAVDKRLQQLSSSKFPEKEHSALESDKRPSSESGNTPLGSRKSSRACPPLGDDDEEETKSSDPPRIDGEDSLSPALQAVNTLANNRTRLVPVSNRHKFKMPSSSSKVNAAHGPYESTDEDDDESPSPDHASSTVRVLDEIIEDTTAYREHIRSGGAPENNEQWLAHWLPWRVLHSTRGYCGSPGTVGTAVGYCTVLWVL